MERSSGVDDGRPGQDGLGEPLYWDTCWGLHSWLCGGLAGCGFFFWAGGSDRKVVMMLRCELGRRELQWELFRGRGRLTGIAPAESGARCVACWAMPAV